MNIIRSRVLASLGVLIIVGAALVSGCGGGGTSGGGTEGGPPSGLSEQPDEATFTEYFTDIGLGVLPAGEELPGGLQRNVTVFNPSDGVCVYGTLTKEVLLSVAIYDTVAEEFTSPKQAFPHTLQTGSFASCGGALPVGEYEYKVYVGDTLVAVLPFEVHE